MLSNTPKHVIIAFHHSARCASFWRIAALWCCASTMACVRPSSLRSIKAVHLPQCREVQTVAKTAGAETRAATAIRELLSAHHPIVIEGAATRDARDPVPVAAQLVRRLREHWVRRPPPPTSRGPIIIIQGDPLAPTGISAITRAVAAELGLPRALVCLDASHARDADRHGVVIELRLSELVALPSSAATTHGAATAKAVPGQAMLRGAIEHALREKNAARQTRGDKALPAWFSDYAMLQEATKGALQQLCGALTVVHTQPAAEISPFSVTSFYAVGLALGLYTPADVVLFEDE